MGKSFRIEPSPPEKPRPFIAGLSLGRLLAVGILLGLGLWLHGLVGLLLLLAGTDLAMSRQPLAPRPVCWPALGFAVVGMLLIDPAVAFEAVRAGRAFLVDVRSEQSFRARRAAGAMLLAVDDIELNARDAVRRLPAGKQPILYCT